MKRGRYVLKANTKNVKLTQIIEVYLKKRTACAEEAMRFPARYGAMRSKSSASGIKTGRVAAVLNRKGPKRLFKNRKNGSHILDNGEVDAEAEKGILSEKAEQMKRRQSRDEQSERNRR